MTTDEIIDWQEALRATHVRTYRNGEEDPLAEVHDELVEASAWMPRGEV